MHHCLQGKPSCAHGLHKMHSWLPAGVRNTYADWITQLLWRWRTCSAAAGKAGHNTYSTCINAYSTPKDSVCFIDMEIDCIQYYSGDQCAVHVHVGHVHLCSHHVYIDWTVRFQHILWRFRDYTPTSMFVLLSIAVILQSTTVALTHLLHREKLL